MTRFRLLLKYRYVISNNLIPDYRAKFYNYPKNSLEDALPICLLPIYASNTVVYKCIKVAYSSAGLCTNLQKQKFFLRSFVQMYKCSFLSCEALYKCIKGNFFSASVYTNLQKPISFLRAFV
jgi:hypothetical protein